MKVGHRRAEVAHEQATYTKPARPSLPAERRVYLERTDPTAHRTSEHNMRLHASRNVVRFLVLIAADLASYLGTSSLLHQLRAGNIVLNAAEYMPKVGYLGGYKYLPAMFIGLMAMGCYERGDHWRRSGRLLRACALATGLALWSQLGSVSLAYLAFEFTTTVLVFGAWLTIVRKGLGIVVDRYLRKPVLARTLLIGSEQDCASTMAEQADYRRVGLELVGIADISHGPAHRSARLEGLERMLQTGRIDTVLLCGAIPDEQFGAVIRASIASECRVLSTMRSMLVAGVRPSVLWYGGEPLVELRTPALRARQLLVKRTMDIVFASLALLVLSPLMIMISIAIRLEDGAPALFKQQRPGAGGVWFKMFKFRSMRLDAEQVLMADPEAYQAFLNNDCKLPPECDPRITRIGRFLRRTSLDELPQLLNVLRGDMSIVGPRPVVGPELRHYAEWTAAVLRAKPGMTGWWQVKGRSTVAFPERAAMDIHYVSNWSLGLDLRIMFLTVPAVLHRRGAY